MTTLRLATRGSDLARRQAATVREALSGRRVDVDPVEVSTRGDEVRDELIHRLGRTGAFVRALDREVLDGDCDLAVHSMKDVPTEFPEDLVVAGVPESAPGGDVLVTADGGELSDLPDGAVVGTASVRRRAQLLAERPDLDVRPLRGNVDTRIGKLLAPALQAEHERRLLASDEDAPEAADDGAGSDSEAVDAEFERTPEEWFDDLSELRRRALELDPDHDFDAIVLAEAGLRRLDLFGRVEATRLPRDRFVSAAGQGTVAVVAAAADVIDRVHRDVDHAPTRVETTVERTVLAELGGGCVAPIGVRALLQGEHVKTTVQVLSQDGEGGVRETRDLPATDHVAAAVEFVADLADRGAADLVAAATAEPTEPKREVE